MTSLKIMVKYVYAHFLFLTVSGAGLIHTVKLVDHPFGYSPTPISDLFTLGDDLQQEASSEDSNWYQYFKDSIISPPRLEERGNVTSKIITACYVTKAAALFMISVQQDASVPAKKRKLQ